MVTSLAVVFAGFSAVLAVPAAVADAPYVWWEGEESVESNFPETSYFRRLNPDEADKLSGRDWLAADGQRSGPTLFAEYKVDVTENATHNFWVRKFWKHGPFKWRFDDQAWQECTRDCALADSVTLRLHLGANWVYLGPVKLIPGSHTFRFETLDAGAVGMDAFVLTTGMFVPRGKLKPGETSGRREPGWFAWEPPGDPLADDCPIDLRRLNEKEAGESGFVRRLGDGFALGDGTPVRFVEKGTCDPFMHRSLVDHRARRLAKYGVNMARTGFALHYPRWAKGDKGDAAEMAKFDNILDRIHYMIAAMKKQGIYTWMRLYWNTGQTEMFFDDEFQRHFLKYADYILNSPNPYTGLPMSKDPAVAVVAIQNENNLFFWTFNPQRIGERPRGLIEQRFGQWVTAKYGSIDKALEAWGPGNPPARWYKDAAEDHPGEGCLGLYGIGHLTGLDWAAPQRNPGRASDQLQFMVEAQKGSYERIVGAFRKDLGLKNLIACSNWKTADPKTLGVFEHYSYTPGDVICRNIYYDVEYGPKPERFHAVDLGDTYTAFSSLRPPELPSSFTIAHMGDMPYAVTENNWCRPNCYRVEWPFLVATYGSMLGMDSWSFNGEGESLWNTTMEVWDVNSPSVLGQLPAVSCIIRRGYVKEAPVAVSDTLSLTDLYAFKGCSIYGLKGQDALWVSKIGDKEAKEMTFSTKVDPLAFFVGRVKRTVTDGPAQLETVDLPRYIDRDKKVVTSLTGEVTWDFDKGVVIVDTPCAQGACGFLGAKGRIELGDTIIEDGNEYGSVLVVSLDGLPLKTSRKVLIQAGTEDRTFGFKTEELGNGRHRITDLGDYPLVVREIDATVTIKGVGPEGQVEILDGNGYRIGQLPRSEENGNGLRVRLPSDSLYTLITR